MNREVRLFDELDRFAAGYEISHAIALTYGYDGDVANERLWKPLVERYGVRHPLVIADGVVDAGTALGVQVLKARRRRGVFHPKLFLAVRDDAAFVALGSANLTRGGLGANLELMTALHFAKDADRCPPRSVLEAVLDFVEGHVAASLHGRVAEVSLEVVRDVVRHARLVAETLPAKSKGPELAFVHSYDEPIWAQLRRIHGEDPVTEMVVVSPFLQQEDPEADDADTLMHQVVHELRPSGTPAATPWMRLHVSPLGKGMALPVKALGDLPAGAAELWPQRASIEPRRLHAKLVGLVGHKRTTVLWGSPNFTPSALLRVAKEDGNVECGLVLGVPSSGGDVLQELDLAELFHRHHGALPEAGGLGKPSPTLLAIGEALYDPASRAFTLHGEAFDDSVARIRASLLTVEGPIALLDVMLEKAGPFELRVDAPAIEEEDPETGQRRLRSVQVLIEALDASGAVVATETVRMNVAFGDALELRDNLLLGKQAVTADALLVPTNAPPEQRVAAVDSFIASLKTARSAGRMATSRHQASLDGFFRNVRLGLDARVAGLQRRKGSRYALLRWSHELRRALAVAQQADPARRMYLMNRVVEHIAGVLGAIPGWHAEPAAAFSALEPGKLADAIDFVPLDDVGLDPGAFEKCQQTRGSVVAELRRFT